MTKKVLLTGATGLIGRQIIAPLLARDFSVAVFSRGLPKNFAYRDDARVTFLRGDLFSTNDIREICETARADYLLHLAWFTGKNYQHDNLNFDYAVASLRLLREFQQAGGKRAIAAGTCFEYRFQDVPLTENSPLELSTPYEKCKHHWRGLADAFCAANGVGFGWGRIFFVYGAGENPQRLGGKLAEDLPNGKTVTVKSSQLLRDYLYTKDIAEAFAAFLDSKVNGEVNICAGRGVTLGDFAKHYADAFNARNFLQLGDSPASPATIVGDNSRLRNEVGFTPRYDFPTAIAEIIAENQREKSSRQ